jgi:hypothetical protein
MHIHYINIIAIVLHPLIGGNSLHNGLISQLECLSLATLHILLAHPPPLFSADAHFYGTDVAVIRKQPTSVLWY